MEVNQYKRSYQKIFRSLFLLEFCDAKIQTKYETVEGETLRKCFPYFNACLLYIGTLLTFFEAVLIYNNKDLPKNLKYNFYYTTASLCAVIALWLASRFKIFKIPMLQWAFLTEFLMENFMKSAISIIAIYLKQSVETISFIFIIKFFLKLMLSFIIKNFTTCFKIYVVQIIYNCCFLLSIHLLRAVIQYLIVDTFFYFIILAFVYLNDYMNKKSFYSFYKLQKEKDYFWKVMNFLNISHFTIKNGEITKETKMDQFIEAINFDMGEGGERNLNLKIIEKLLSFNLVAVPCLPKEIEHFFSDINKNFQFVEFISIISQSEEAIKYFSEFARVGVLKFNKSNNDDPVYFQLLLQIKFGKDFSNSKENDFSKLKNVKFSALLFDITQLYMKKEIQKNSLILSKYIHDIKSPLFLLNQMIKKYQFKLNLLIKEYSNHKNINGESQNFTKISNDLKENSKHFQKVTALIFDNIESINGFTKKQNNLFDIGPLENTCTSSPEKMISNFRWINLRKTINFCVDFYKIFLLFSKSKNNLKIYSEIDENLPKKIYTDEMVIKQILMNLLSNAMKFTYKGEVKILCSTKEKEYVEICVIDTGVGILKENIPQLFKPFHFTTSRQVGGTGLGLCIVNDMLQSLGSFLKIESERNLGSKFSFRISLTKVDSTGDPYSSPSSDSVSNSDEESENPCNVRNVIPRFSLPTRRSNLYYTSISNRSSIMISTQVTSKLVIPQTSSRQIFEETDDDKETVIYKDSLRKPLMKQWDDIPEDQVSDFAKNEWKREDEMTLDEREILLGDLNDSMCLTPPFKRCRSEKCLNQKLFININAKPETILRDLNMIKTNDFGRKEEKHTTIPFICNTIPQLNVLLIDDDRSFINQLLRLLRSLSLDMQIKIKADHSSDPMDALGKIYKSLFEGKDEYYHVIITDENMPFLRGSEFIKFYNEKLLANGFYKFQTISLNGEANFQKFEYFDYFLKKPCTKGEIERILHRILNGNLA